MAEPPELAPFQRRPALHGASDFISWTWEMVNAGHEHIGWNGDGTTIVITNPERLASHVLPKYFRRSQYSSWVRALNAYDFHKVGTGSWSHPNFQRGHPEKLKLIVRKKGTVPSNALTAYQAPEREGEVEDLRGMLDLERNRLRALAQELTRLEHEVDSAQREEFQQRFDTVRLTQLMLSNLPIQAAAAIPTIQSSSSRLEDGTPISGPAVSSSPRGRGGSSRNISRTNTRPPSRSTSRPPSPPRLAPRVTRSDGATGILQNQLMSLLDIGTAPSDKRAVPVELVREGVEEIKRARTDEAAARSVSQVYPTGYQYPSTSTTHGNLQGQVNGAQPYPSVMAQPIGSHSSGAAGPHGGAITPSNGAAVPPTREELETAVNLYFEKLADAAERGLGVLEDNKRASS